jgi:hypothetical protein
MHREEHYPYRPKVTFDSQIDDLVIDLELPVFVEA